MPKYWYTQPRMIGGFKYPGTPDEADWYQHLQDHCETIRVETGDWVDIRLVIKGPHAFNEAIEPLEILEDILSVLDLPSSRLLNAHILRVRTKGAETICDIALLDKLPEA